MKGTSIPARYNRFVLFAARQICSFRNWIAAQQRKYLGRKSRILVVKDDGMGDLVVWIPYAFSLRRHFPPPEYEIVMLVQTPQKHFAEEIRCADRIISLPPYKNKCQWLCCRLGFWFRFQFDMILGATMTPNDILLPYRLKKSITLSYEWNWYPPGFLPYETVVYADKLSIHARYDAILQYLKIPFPFPRFEFRKMGSPVRPEWLQKPYFAVCFGAGVPRRCWEEEKFVLLIDRLVELTHKKVCLVGNGKEYEKGERIRNACKTKNLILNLSGKTTIGELFTLIRHSDFLVSNETGTAHIGGVLETRTFIICGGGDYGNFVPYPEGIEGKRVFSIFHEKKECFSCGWKHPFCIQQKTYPCISAITVDEVFRIMEKKIHGQSFHQSSKRRKPATTF